ncbi:MAG: arginine decarboxylase [Deltaproteobacteria bacterium]|nr:MAG: arginine decarboxylase [Deltaproteobacteria bacterium]
MIKKQALERWSVQDAADLYTIQNWGVGYFDISSKGNVVVTPFPDNKRVAVDLTDVIKGIRDRGYAMPVLLRIEDILDSQIRTIHETFRAKMKEFAYKGSFKGVFPIKVNQQQQVVEEITRFGEQYHHGLEAGSKAELIAALSLLKDREACLICNGYKDEEFVDLGLYATQMGVTCFFVLEMPSELSLILARSKALGIRPLIGVRIKLSTQAGGHWTDSGGDRSIFGLSATQVVDVVDTLKEEGMLDCLQLLHYHLGSQIPNIRDLRFAVMEGCRMYAGLVKEGAPMTYLDIGGGLAVDYDGSHTNYTNSRNYSLDEYCADIIDTIMVSLDEENIPHPVIITESGRATVAYYSILLFNVLDVSRFEPPELPVGPDSNDPEIITNLFEVRDVLSLKNLQECYNDAMYYRDEARQLFKLGQLSLRQRSLAEKIFWHIILRVAKELKHLKFIPKDLKHLPDALADIYYCNFSVFQSLPDAWAIDHLFPVMPIHRLDEMPGKQGTLADITCDCDGKIDRFIDVHGVQRTLPLHDLKEDEEYYLGAFLVGAYQETLGDLHNLLGDTNVVSIRISEDGDFSFVREVDGDSVADVLSYVEYDPKNMLEDFRKLAEAAVRAKRITPQERGRIVRAYADGLRGYTYFER